MKKNILSLIIISGMLFLGYSCGNRSGKEGKQPSVSDEISSSLLLIGKDIITEVILKPDSLGDPWELEKVKNFNGKTFFTRLFENIYSKKITVYDVFTDKPLTPEDVKKREDEFNGDFSKIGKVQFQEDWYFNPAAGSITKTIKSVTFAYTIKRDPGLPAGYKGLFKLKVNE